MEQKIVNKDIFYINRNSKNIYMTFSITGCYIKYYNSIVQNILLKENNNNLIEGIIDINKNILNIDKKLYEYLLLDGKLKQILDVKNMTESNKNLAINKYILSNIMTVINYYIKYIMNKYYINYIVPIETNNEKYIYKIDLLINIYPNRKPVYRDFYITDNIDNFQFESLYKYKIYKGTIIKRDIYNQNNIQLPSYFIIKKKKCYYYKYLYYKIQTFLIKNK